ncbi:MAG: S-formylglutathione hydrolase [Pseudomonadales bacterium]|nr:S-formylglutathione hydrolase [Pseudomonadales bacterium]
MEQLASNKCFGGTQSRHKHFSTTCICEMTFSIFLPEQLATGADVKLPVLYWLSGLTCTDENFVQKAGAQRLASELGLIIVCPDTSPRGDEVPDDEQGAYDFGLGAGFYLNATEEPWAKYYNMYDYVVEELPEVVARNFPIDINKQSIFGHSMGGHGALTIALKNPDKYHSVSAFAPICSPINCSWGHKALKNYIGEDQELWSEYDAVELVKSATRPIPMLVDQGSADEFLKEQLKPELLVEACNRAGMPLGFNQRDGYDHSYFFISSFIENHLRFHHGILSMLV